MSWEQFGAILDQARQAAEAEAGKPPVACPNDATPLESVNGVLHCPFDGYVHPPGAQTV